MIVCFPHKPGKGGPGSFQTRFEKALLKRDIAICYAATSVKKPDVLFIVGGTKKIGWLLQMKIKGVPIIYRLDGINWLHKMKSYGVKKYLVDEYRNINSKLIHAFIANSIIYQSEFVKNWWNSAGLRKVTQFNCIHNGVDLNEFNAENQLPESSHRVVILEGTIDYTPYAIDLINKVAFSLPNNFTIDLYGSFENLKNKQKIDKKINYHGSIPRENVPLALKNAIYLSLDINAACPNTVAEALASGSPVVGFDTGALKELVTNDSGIIVDYGGNPWKLDTPDYQGLIDAVIKISTNYNFYAANARKLAVERYNIDTIVNQYINVILEEIKKKKRN